MKRPRRMEMKLLAPDELAQLLAAGGFCPDFERDRRCELIEQIFENDPPGEAHSPICRRCILDWLNEEVDPL